MSAAKAALRASAHPALVVPFWLVVSAALAAHAGPRWWIALGAASWCVVEYAGHRWLLHGLERHHPGAYRKAHGVHHAYPTDAGHFGIPLVATVPVLGLLAIACSTIGAGALAWLSGLLAGMAAYDLLHLACHGYGPAVVRRAVRPWARHHARHHRHGGRAFAVSAPFLDRIGGTS